MCGKTRATLAIVASLITITTTSLFAKGILQITSADSAIQWDVKIDGKTERFRSGMELQLDEGTHRITASAPGYQTIDQSLKIRDGVVKKITLQPSRSKIVETTEQESFSAQQKTSRLVVVGRPNNISFSVDGQSSKTPASFNLGVGSHRLVAGNVSEAFQVPEDLVTYLKVDSNAAKIYGFSMTEAQESEIQSTAGSREEVFEKGYRLYGKDSSPWTTKAILAIAAAVLVFVLYLRLRFSLKGRAKARIRKRRSLQRRLSRIPPEDPKSQRENIESAIERNASSIDKFKERLTRRADKLRSKLHDLPEDETTAKRRKKLDRRIEITMATKDILTKTQEDTGAESGG